MRGRMSEPAPDAAEGRSCDARSPARPAAPRMIRRMTYDDAPTDVTKTSSVTNALRILSMLTRSPGLRVVDVSRTLGVANSTAHRLLSTMRDQGFLRQGKHSSRYVPGGALIDLSRHINSEFTLVQSAMPHLMRLRDSVNETVNLQILVGTEVLFLASAEDQHQLRVLTRSGTRSLAHANAGGKLLLAQLAPHEIRKRIGERPAALTAKTHVDPASLLAELRSIRQRGYSLNQGETDDGVNAVAVPVFDALGAVVAALSVAAPASRLPLVRVPSILPHMQEASTAITVGYFDSQSGDDSMALAQTRIHG